MLGRFSDCSASRRNEFQEGASGVVTDFFKAKLFLLSAIAISQFYTNS